MSASRVAITGNTYPVREQIKSLGGRWDAARKAWMVDTSHADEARRIVAAGAGQSTSSSHSYHPRTCRTCGAKEGPYTKIFRNGECHGCYEERQHGY